MDIHISYLQGEIRKTCKYFPVKNVPNYENTRIIHHQKIKILR